MKKFVHKIGILIGLLIFFTSSVCAQYIANIEIIPDNPSIGDDIETIGTVEFTFGTPSTCPNMIGYEIIEKNLVIIINVFYDVSGIWQALGCESIDTFFIENLSQGIEKIVVNTNTISDNNPPNIDTVFSFDSDTLNLNLVGIKEAEESNSINVYPNPNTGEFTIEMNILKVQDVEITLFNITGQVIYNENLKRFKGAYFKRINTKGLSTGVYQLQVKTGYGEVNKKVVVE